jgi:hypothetical protein
MIGTQLGLNLAVIYAGLLLFGLAYNALTAWLEFKKYAEGYTSDLVVIGVAATVLPFLTLAGMYPAWQIVFYIFGGFVCSGLPMAVGSKMRHAKARENDQQAARLAE